MIHLIKLKSPSIFPANVNNKGGENMKLKRQRVGYYILPILLLIIAAIAFISFNLTEKYISKEATAGKLKISSQDLLQGKGVQLNGQWEFYKDNLLEPKDFKEGYISSDSDDYMNVPGSWKGQIINGEKLSSNGYATYRLQVYLPQTETKLGLSINSITSSYRIWVNGQLMDEKGKVGTTREITKPFKRPQVIPLKLEKNEAEIIIQVANFSQRKAGILAPIVLGDYNKLEEMLFKKVIISAMVAGTILVTGLHHFVLFVRMRYRYESLWFGLICLILGFKNMAEGPHFLAYIFPQLSNNVLVTIEYIGFIGAGPLFTLFIYSFFPKIMSSRMRNVLIFPGFLFLLIVLFTPVYFFTKLAIVMQVYTIIISLVLLVYIFKTVKNGLEGAFLFSAGAIAFFITICNDILVNNGTVVQSETIFSFGLLFIIICMEIILSLKLYNAYRTIEEMSNRMIQLDKVKDEFLANTSHELRTPLNGMIGLAQSLLFSLKNQLDKDHERQLEMIVSSGQRLYYLINDILDYSRLMNNDIRLNWSYVNLHQLIQVIFTVIQPLTEGRKLILNNHVERDFPLILADENRLVQILFNLIGNAVKYTPQGQVAVRARQYGGFVEVYVEDTGVGIPKDKFETIFQPFEQLSESDEEGTGLGLKITKQLVEIHGGRIWVESEVGKGSKFIFTISQERGKIEQKTQFKGQDAPIKREKNMNLIEMAKKFTNHKMDDHSSENKIQAFQEIASTQISATVEMKSQTKKTLQNEDTPYRVLIVDDEAVNLQVVMHQLTSLPCKVDTVISGEEVLSFIEQLHHYDLVITDLMMPGMSGFELCYEIRKRYQLDELPILIMTAGHREDTIVTAFNAGANDYISKPFDRNELISRVKTLILMKRAVQEVRQQAKEMKKLNHQLTELNLSLEERIQERTLKLKEMNEMLEMRNKELSRLESVRRRLLTDVSHELRTPMTAIQGYVEAIVSGLVDDPNEQQRYLTMVLSKTRSLNRLVQDLFELSRLESRRSDMIFEIIPLSNLVIQIKDKFALDVKQAGLNYRFQLNFDTKLLDQYQVIIDMDRIIQVLTNLVFNSIKYTESGGEVGIICDIKTVSKVEDAAGELVIHVEDTGRGIAPESLPFVFDRFYRDETQSVKHGVPRGSGIGLAIAKEIVQYHDGTINVKSAVGQGTMFTFTLPLFQLNI